MAVAKQIKIFSNFKKQSSKDSKTKNSIINIANEYERIGEQKNPDINCNLSSENLILKKFDIKEYEKIIENTDYNLNSKNSKYEDIYSTTPTIQATNFVNLGGINLTFLMEKDEWVEYYKDLSDFIKDYMGDSFITLSEVIQFDEFTPHLQVMGIFRSEVSNEILSNKNLESDPKLFEEISRKQFTRYNNKLKGTDNYVDPKNKKEYKEAKIKWVEENKGNIIKNYKPRNKTTEKKYAYIRNDNPLATKKNSYADYQNKLYEFNKEHKFIKKICEKASIIRGEEVSFVKNSTEPVYDGKSKNHYEIKETIERENKEIESKIQKGIDLTENEVYRYIRKQNREKLKQEFLELNIDSWGKKFNEPQEAKYNFNLKLSNDYVKTAKEIAYKPYMKLESDVITKKEELNNIENQLEDKNIKLIGLNNEIQEKEKIKAKYKEDKTWYNVNTINTIDNRKEVKRKGNIPFTKEYKQEIVVLDKKDYDIMLTMSKNQSTQLTAWSNHSKKLEKDNKEKEEKIVNKNKELSIIKEQIQILQSEKNRINELVNKKNKEIEKLKIEQSQELEKKDNEIMKLKNIFRKAMDFIKKIPYINKVADKLEEYLKEDYRTEKEQLRADINFNNNILKYFPKNEFNDELIENIKGDILERKEKLEEKEKHYQRVSRGFSR